jgi:hypothetical protein
MTARSRRPPLIFQADEVPLARSEVSPSGNPESVVQLDVSPSVDAVSRVAHGGEDSIDEHTPEVNPVNLVNLVNRVNSTQDDKTPKFSGLDQAIVQPKVDISGGTTGGAKALPSPPSDHEMSFRDVLESPERVQIGPRIHPSYKVFLEDLFHPIRHQSDGGMQTMLMACLEVVRRDPELQRQAQSWASEAESTGQDNPS